MTNEAGALQVYGTNIYTYEGAIHVRRVRHHEMSTRVHWERRVKGYLEEGVGSGAGPPWFAYDPGSSLEVTPCLI